MKSARKKRLFKKILVPILHGCEQNSAINAARAIAGPENVILVGFVYVPESESLSSAAVPAQEVRQMLRSLSTAEHVHRGADVYATHHPWDEIVRVAEKEKPDLLILEYPRQFETIKATAMNVLSQPPCDIAIVNSHISEDFKNVLIPVRGGPYAELALRTALSMKRFKPIAITSLHMVPTNLAVKQDAAFRGIERVLKNLPEVKEQQRVADKQAEVLFDASRQFDLIVMGASAR